MQVAKQIQRGQVAQPTEAGEVNFMEIPQDQAQLDEALIKKVNTPNKEGEHAFVSLQPIALIKVVAHPSLNVTPKGIKPSASIPVPADKREPFMKVLENARDALAVRLGCGTDDIEVYGCNKASIPITFRRDSVLEIGDDVVSAADYSKTKAFPSYSTLKKVNIDGSITCSVVMNSSGHYTMFTSLSFKRFMAASIMKSEFSASF